jgi:hypothetical protein
MTSKVWTYTHWMMQLLHNVGNINNPEQVTGNNKSMCFLLSTIVKSNDSEIYDLKFQT